MNEANTSLPCYLCSHLLSPGFSALSLFPGSWPLFHGLRDTLEWVRVLWGLCWGCPRGNLAAGRVELSWGCCTLESPGAAWEKIDHSLSFLFNWSGLGTWHPCFVSSLGESLGWPMDSCKKISEMGLVWPWGRGLKRCSSSSSGPTLGGRQTVPAHLLTY